MKLPRFVGETDSQQFAALCSGVPFHEVAIKFGTTENALRSRASRYGWTRYIRQGIESPIEEGEFRDVKSLEYSDCSEEARNAEAQGEDEQPDGQLLCVEVERLYLANEKTKRKVIDDLKEDSERARDTLSRAMLAFEKQVSKYEESLGIEDVMALAKVASVLGQTMSVVAATQCKLWCVTDRDFERASRPPKVIKEVASVNDMDSYTRAVRGEYYSE